MAKTGGFSTMLDAATRRAFNFLRGEVDTLDERVTIIESGGGGDFPEAPLDGQQYGRQSGAWTVVDSSGSVWRVGSGAPAVGLGADGDFYLDEATGDVHEKSSGVWSLVANITGPPGPGIEDAPSDGDQYARQDGAWTVVSGGGGDYLPLTGGTLTGDLKVSGRLTVKAGGGAANPAIAFDGIDGMGIYTWSGDLNQMRFSVAGAQRLAIKEDAVIVNNDLQVDGTITTGPGKQIFLGGNWDGALIANTSASGREYMNFGQHSDGGARLRLYGPGDASYPGNAYIYGGGAVAARFDKDQNTKLYGDLQVDGHIEAKTGGQTAPSYGWEGDTEGLGLYGSPSSQWLRFTTGGLWRFQIGTEQVIIKPDLRVQGQTLAQDGTNAAPAYSFASDTDTGIHRPHSNVIEMVGNGKRMLQLGIDAGSTETGAWMPTINTRTISTPANVHISPNAAQEGALHRSTASRAFMQEVESVSFEATNSVYDLEPIWFRSTCDGDNIEHSHYGLAAEDCAAVDPRLAIMATDEDGVETADNVNTNAVIALLVSAVKGQRETIESLLAKVKEQDTTIATLTATVEALTARIETLENQ